MNLKPGCRCFSFSDLPFENRSNAYGFKRSPEASWHADYRDTAYIFIGGLPFDLTEGDIVTIFSQFGEPVYVNLIRDKESGKSKGFAFLKYEDQRSTDLAVDNLGGANVLGRTLKVDHTRYKRKDAEDELEREQALNDEKAVDGNGHESDKGSEEENRPLLKEEEELATLIRNHDEDDPMKAFIVQEKREEVITALAALKKKSRKSTNRKKHHHHHRRHRSRTRNESAGSGEERKKKYGRSHRRRSRSRSP